MPPVADWPGDCYLYRKTRKPAETHASHGNRCPSATDLPVVRSGDASLGALLFEEDGLFLVLAALVLEPDSYDSRAEARHLHKLFLHHGVGSGVGGVTCPECVQLFLVQHRPDARGFLGFPPSWWRPVRLSIRLACRSAVGSVINRDNRAMSQPTEAR